MRICIFLFLVITLFSFKGVTSIEEIYFYEECGNKYKFYCEIERRYLKLYANNNFELIKVLDIRARENINIQKKNGKNKKLKPIYKKKTIRGKWIKKDSKLILQNKSGTKEIRFNLIDNKITPICNHNWSDNYDWNDSRRNQYKILSWNNECHIDTLVLFNNIQDKYEKPKLEFMLSEMQ